MANSEIKMSQLNEAINNIINTQYKIKPKSIGNATSSTDLNTIYESGFYYSSNSKNLFTNLPSGLSGAFELFVSGINPNGVSYTTQLIKDYRNNNFFVRTNSSSTSTFSWTPWQSFAFQDGTYSTMTVGKANILTTARNLTIGNTAKSFNGSANVLWSISEIGAVNKIGDTMTGNLKITTSLPSMLNLYRTGTDLNNSIQFSLKDGTVNKYFGLYDTDFKIGTSEDLSNAYLVWHSGNFNPNNKLNISGGVMTGNIQYNLYNSTQTPLEIYGGDSNGQGIRIGAGGATIISSGEGKNQISANIGAAANEVMAIGSDIGIDFYTSLQNGWASRKSMSMGTNGVLTNTNGFSGPLTGNASTATSLQTARTINGTSFNGTANITTANWGTSRTITIGNTAKNVNGSTNVSWSLSEIGVYSKNEVDQLKAQGIGSETIIEAIHSKDTREINSKPNEYNKGLRVEFKRNSVIGAPFNEKESLYCGLINIRPYGSTSDFSGGSMTQIAIGSYSGANNIGLRYRNGTNTSWGSWVKVYDSSNCNVVPSKEVANNARFLRNDNTWQTVTPSNIGAYTKSETYSKEEVDKKNYIKNVGRVTAHDGSGNARVPNGIRVIDAYNNGYPESYGNVIQVGGTGDAELFLGWSGSSSSASGIHANNYIRSKRDSTGTLWSGWAKLWTSANFNPASYLALSGGTMTGMITKTQSGSWINGRDSSILRMTTNDSSYGSFATSRGSTHTFAVGVLGNSQIGFYSYLNSRSENGTDASFYMDKSGNCIATGNITGYSDITMKENIEKISNALEKIKLINGYTYNMISNKQRQAGVIAQEVEKILPEVVLTHENGKKSVAYGNMISLLIEAIKELNDKIDKIGV